MTTLPEPVKTALVRGAAAFMQAARPTDLPPVLRPLKGRHLKMLTARRDDIIAALEDEVLRALVLDWLKDDPSGISRADARVLETFTRRDQGWEEALSAPAETSSRPEPTTRDSEAALEKAKERARRAKDEARRARADAEKDLAAERRAKAALKADLDDARQQIEDLEKQVAAATRDLAGARAEADRELRKARKRAEKAEAALEQQRAKTRAVRAELAAARAKAGPRRKEAPATKPRATQALKEPSRRRRLPVPKGRFEDAPETLTEWLSTPAVHLLVDGYNVSKAEGGFGDLALERQRDLLLQEVGKVARRHKIAATVIFDGSHIAPGTSRRPRGPVQVEYSRPDEIADDHLVAKLADLPNHPVVVVTNDRELQRRAARLGATIATSGQLLRLIR